METRHTSSYSHEQESPCLDPLHPFIAITQLSSLSQPNTINSCWSETSEPLLFASFDPSAGIEGIEGKYVNARQIELGEVRRTHRASKRARIVEDMHDLRFQKLPHDVPTLGSVTCSCLRSSCRCSCCCCCKDNDRSCTGCPELRER